MTLSEVKAKFFARVEELGCTWNDNEGILDPPAGFAFDRLGKVTCVSVLDYAERDRYEWGLYYMNDGLFPQEREEE